MLTIKSKIRNALSLPFVRNTLKLSSSSVILLFLPLLVTPILSRLYTPADYGDWGLFSSVLTIVTTFLFLSYENTIIKTNDKGEVPNLVALAALTSLLVILFVTGIFLVGKFCNISFFKNFPRFGLLVLLLVFTSIHTLCDSIANRESRYGLMSIARIINGFTQATSRIIFGIWPLVTYGLIVGNVLAQILATCYVFIRILDLLGGTFFSKISLKEIKRLAIKNKKFPLFDAPAKMIEIAIGQLVIIVLSFFYPKDQIGCLSMVIQFILLPISVIGSSMANVYYRELSEGIDRNDAISLTTTRAGKLTFILSVIPILFLALGGDKLLVLFLGNKWLTAGPIALCLVIYSVPVILSEPLLPIFRVLDRQEIRFRYDIIDLVFSIGVLLLASAFGLSMYWALIIYAVSHAIIRFFMFFREIKLANVVIKSISSTFVPIISAVYAVLFFRLFFMF